jgi:proteasome lid subunit RPN8/RPN11
MSAESPVEILCSDENMNDLESHCFSETRVEVGGFLLGKIENGKTSVNRVVKAKHTVSKSTQLTFTHKTWDSILEDIKKHDDGNDLVGWYHSHPNFGVFLSDHDQFIQNNFFKEDGRVTIVVDPIRGKKGWFYSHNGKIGAVPETDTTREKLGESSTDPDKNIDLKQISQKQFVTLPALLITSLIFSILSFGLGVLIS